MRITEEEKEQMIQFKNENVRNILAFLESRSRLLELDWQAYNEIRNVIRYEGNRNLNRNLRLLGVTEAVRMSRAENGN